MSLECRRRRVRALSLTREKRGGETRGVRSRRSRRNLSHGYDDTRRGVEGESKRRMVADNGRHHRRSRHNSTGASSTTVRCVWVCEDERWRRVSSVYRANGRAEAPKARDPVVTYIYLYIYIYREREGRQKTRFLVARWFFKDFRPGSRFARSERRSRSLVDTIPPLSVGIPSLCRVAPVKRGGGPRVLGRAASLIFETHTETERKRETSPRGDYLVRNLTITLNGGSLGSWVDEERS